MIVDPAFSRHGGALNAARRTFPDAPEPWVDLSTGINPRSYPVEGLTCADWARLPDEAAVTRLERTAALRYGAPPWTDVVAAPGTQAIIQQLPTLLGGRDVRVLGRTYSEFGRVFAAAGARTTTVPSVEHLAGADVAVVVNPNNPDGRLLTPADLLALAPRCGRLIVDEAFADALPSSASVVPQLPASRIVVLRSFGKIHGLAGLRLGFAVGSPSTIIELRRLLGPWAVSGPAIAIGTKALADDAWLAATRSRLEEDGARLGYVLRRAGAEPIGETPLFHLVSHVAAPALFVALARRGILARPFAGASSWLRLGLPCDEAAWSRLDEALRRFG